MQTFTPSQLDQVSQERARIDAEIERTSNNLNAYVEPYKNNNGLVVDAVWLHDAECQRLKRSYNLAAATGRAFNLQHREELKQLRRTPSTEKA